MKAAILAVLLCFSAVSLSCQPKNSPTKDEKTTAQTPSDRKAATETESTKRSSPHWYASSEWWLVIIAALTGAAIAYQAGEMVSTTKSIQRQSELQEANLAQWVDLKSWGLLVETTSRTSPPKEVTLNLRWRVLNNTPFPFTLQKVEVKVAIGLDWEHFEIIEDGTIAPSKSSNNYFDFMVPFKLTKSQTKSFFDGGAALSITSRVSYIDASGYEQEQYFGDLYHRTFPDKMEVIDLSSESTLSSICTSSALAGWLLSALLPLPLGKGILGVTSQLAGLT
jgi:hypothetical protein